MHNLAECATTTRTIWQNVLQLHAQSGRMSIIGVGIVKYATNSKGEQIVVGAIGDPDVLRPGMIFRDESEVPTHVKVDTLEEIAIDPYQYLGLQEP